MSQYANLLQELRALAANPPKDDATKKEVFEAMREASYAVEGRLDIFGRVGSSALQIALAKILVDLKLFKILAGAAAPKTVDELAQETKASKLLLARVLRASASHGLVTEVGPETFGPSPATRLFSEEGFEAGVRHMYDIETPCFLALPKFLAANGYKDIDNALKAPFGLAFNTDEHAFAYGARHPDLFRDILLFLSAFQSGQPSWLDAFPAEQLTAAGSTPLLLDVGGGIGQQCAALKQKYPNISRQIILQDQPHSIPNAIPTPGVEAQAYDFFTPQPIKGAAFYYIKNCLHDWSDEACAKILENQKSALSADSAILIDEMILPEAGVNWQATNMDMLIMSNSAALERTESHWRRLIESVGLKVKSVHIYNKDIHHGVLVATLP